MYKTSTSSLKTDRHWQRKPCSTPGTCDDATPLRQLKANHLVALSLPKANLKFSLARVFRLMVATQSLIFYEGPFFRGIGPIPFSFLIGGG
jgi:hypothetical protein